VAGCCERSNEVSGATKGGNFLTSWRSITFSRGILLHRVSYTMKICTVLLALYLK